MKLNVTIEEDYDFYESRIIPLGKLVKIGEYRNALYAITMTEIRLTKGSASKINGYVDIGKFEKLNGLPADLLISEIIKAFNGIENITNVGKSGDTIDLESAPPVFKSEFYEQYTVKKEIVDYKTMENYLKRIIDYVLDDYKPKNYTISMTNGNGNKVYVGYDKENEKLNIAEDERQLKDMQTVFTVYELLIMERKFNIDLINHRKEVKDNEETTESNNPRPIS